MGGVIIEDGVDGFAGGNLALDSVEEADELLMAMALHVAADHGSVEDVHGREQSGRSLTLVIMGHWSGAAFLHRQPRLGAVERLDLALDGQDHGVHRGIASPDPHAIIPKGTPAGIQTSVFIHTSCEQMNVNAGRTIKCPWLWSGHLQGHLQTARPIS